MSRVARRPQQPSPPPGALEVASGAPLGFARAAVVCEGASADGRFGQSKSRITGARGAEAVNVTDHMPSRHSARNKLHNLGAADAKRL